MPALIPTFQYDIFISYRHNDNLPSSDSGRPLYSDHRFKEIVKAMGL